MNRTALEYADEEATNAVEHTIVESNILLPTVPRIASSDGQVWTLKLPSAVSFASQPFHPEIYRTEESAKQAAEQEDEDLSLDQRHARALQRMHAVANTVRWKWVDDPATGLPVKRSNSRVVRWSDGSASLMIGQEMWDLQVESVTAAAAEPGQNLKSIKPFGLQEMSQSTTAPIATQSSASGTSRKGPVSLLCSTDFDNKILTTDSLLTGSLVLVPQTRNVRDHPKRLTALTKSTLKKARILAYNDESGVRPDRQIEETVREMQESQKRRLKERGHDLNAVMSLPVWKGGGGGGASTPRESSGRRATTSTSVARGRATYSSSDEDMDARPSHRSRYQAEDYESDDFVVDDEDEEQTEKSKSRRRRHENSDEDSDDLDLDTTAEPKSKKRTARDYSDDDSQDDEAPHNNDDGNHEDSGEEALDVMEREAERLVAAEKRERKQRKRREQQQEETAGDGGVDMEVDNDDQQDEPEEQVDQNVTQKRVLHYDDEDDE